MPASSRNDSTAPRRLLFHRHFRRYSGGHGKVWDYYCHAARASGWEPAIHMTAESTHEQNPWHVHGIEPLPGWMPQDADALFLAGLDWDRYPASRRDLPVINLVQHVRHGDPADPRHRFLQRPAIRICVSAGVAQAISDVRAPNGPVVVIEAGIELPAMPPDGPRHGVFIDAIKQPALGAALADRLREAGWDVRLNDSRIPRSEYLQNLAGARTAVVLPRATEGFYLPGLEAMAMGCATIVPDCVGNRAYLDPGRNALAPPLELDDLVAAVGQLDDPTLHAGLAAAGLATARRFDLARERDAFHRVLDDLPALWRDTSHP